MSRVPVLIISGMHRSATSLAAATLQAAGLDIGARLMGPFPGNPHGHFEDLDFVEIHQEALRLSDLPEDGLLAEGGPLALPPSTMDAARRCIAARQASNHPWGFKDPRTTLFLESWHSLLPHAFWLFLFRNPLQVVDSLRRRGDVIAQDSPTQALRIWMHYNSLILDFAHQHAARTLLFELGTAEDALATLVGTVFERLGLHPTQPFSTYDPGLLSEREVCVSDARPYIRAEATELYRELQFSALGHAGAPTSSS